MRTSRPPSPVQPRHPLAGRIMLTILSVACIAMYYGQALAHAAVPG
jgi:hypothetical protein